MDIIRPYKMVVQFVAVGAINIFNFLMKESDLDEAKRRINNLEHERDNANHRIAYLEEAINGHIITIPDDYFHSLPLIHEDMIISEIDIHNEFESFTNELHLE